MVVLLFVGCASEKSVSTSEAKMVATPSEVPFPYKAELTEIITLTTNTDCNETDFLLYAREKKQVHRMIDIIMKRICSSENDPIYQEEESCSCIYSGIGMKYKLKE